MSLISHNSNNGSGHEIDHATTGEDTLRLIATLTAPAGLEQRVHEALRTAPRKGRVLAWPLRADAGWVRATAAAAIVMVVAGGGWSVYSHIQPWQPARVPGVPARVGTGGFSGAGAVRSPQTPQLPVVIAPPKSAALHPAQKKVHKKSAAAATAHSTVAIPIAK